MNLREFVKEIEALRAVAEAARRSLTRFSDADLREALARLDALTPPSP